MEKEQNRVKKYLVENERWNPNSFEEFDASGSLSHLLVLLMVEFEEESAEKEKKMPTVIPKIVPPLKETDAER